MNEMTSVQAFAEVGDFAMSEQMNELFAALSAAQAEDLNAAAKSINQAFPRARYADLPAIWDAIRGPLSKQSLCIMQFPSVSGKRVSVRTMLGHKSGQWVASTVSATASGEDPQKIGSAVTYLKRYGLSAMVGAASDKDDDGNAASAREQPEAREAAPPPPRPAAPLRAEGQPNTPRPAAQPRADGKPDTLEFLWPNGTVDLARASNNAPVTVVWLRWLSEVLEGARDADGLKAWWEKAGKHISAVQQHYPETAAAAARAYTNRFGELDDSFPASKPNKSMETA